MYLYNPYGYGIFFTQVAIHGVFESHQKNDTTVVDNTMMCYLWAS